MSWSLRISVALVEELSLVPTTYMMVTTISNSMEFQGIQIPLLASLRTRHTNSMLTYKQTKH